jgi:hypothetical protein
MATAFLEVITRCYKRPKMLKRNQASLRAQTDPDWIQTLIVDGIGMGVAWANENLALKAQYLVGEYIWLLDDDDECILPSLVADLKKIAHQHHPEVIMLKMDHGERGILPDNECWKNEELAPGHVGCSAYVVKRTVWQAYAWAWVPGAYDSDFNFFASIWADQPTVYWHDVIASRVQRISLGRPE